MGKGTQAARERWEVETNFRHLKSTMNMEILSCRQVDGVRKELLAYLITYNLVRALMVLGGRNQGVSPLKIS